MGETTPTSPTPVRILLVDDFEPWRRWLCSILQAQRQLIVVGEVADGLEAVQKTRELQPDLILLDISLPICFLSRCFNARDLIVEQMPNPYEYQPSWNIRYCVFIASAIKQQGMPV